MTFYSFAYDQLEPAKAWEEMAHGVWKLKIGSPDEELSYTSLAGRAPRIEALNALSQVPFPFEKTPLQVGTYDDDRSIILHIPTAADESIYGFGLQLDGIKKSGKVLDLNVDHWAKGEEAVRMPRYRFIFPLKAMVYFLTPRVF